MPVEYKFIGNLFRIDLIDAYTPDEIVETFTRALSDPDFPPHAKFLFDVRKSTVLSTRSAGDLRKIAEFFAAHSEKVGRKCAIVASEPVHFGLSRMAATFSELKGATVKVFIDTMEALEWLGVEDDQVA